MCHHPIDGSLYELSEDDRQEILAEHDEAELAEEFTDEELETLRAA